MPSNHLTGLARDLHYRQMARAQRKSASPILRRASRRRGRQGSERVQLRPAWADSVLLYWGSSVAYEHSGLDDDLVAELEAWDTSYYDRVNTGGQWRSAAAHDAHRIEGARVAQRVADALGRAFAVEVDERIVQSRHPPASPASAAAFEAHRGEREAELHRFMEYAASQAGHDHCLQTAEHHLASQPGQWLRELRAETTKRIRVVLNPEDAVCFPVEVVVDGQPGYVDADMLGVSATLRQDLESFQDWWEQHARDDDEGTDASEEPEWAQWSRQGIQLVERLQAELGDEYYVTWN
jgi:hypothetical protein